MIDTKKENPEIAELIKSGLIRKYGGLKAAFRNLGLLSYDSLRQDLSKNRFFEVDLLRLCSEIDLPTEIHELRQKYVFTIKRVKSDVSHKTMKGNISSVRPMDPFSVIDSRMERMRQTLISANEIVPKYFQAMGKNDLLVSFLSDEFPSHWIGPQAASWAKIISDALSLGAMIVYFHPSEELCKKIRETGCSATMLGPDIVKIPFESFKKRLLSVSNNKFISDNIVLVECNNPVVFSPQHRYSLSYRRSENKLDVRGSETVPVRLDPSVEESSSHYWVFSVSYKFTAFLQQICEWTLNESLINQKQNQKQKETLENILHRCYALDNKK